MATGLATHFTENQKLICLGGFGLSPAEGPAYIITNAADEFQDKRTGEVLLAQAARFDSVRSSVRRGITIISASAST
jgi:hypothetical protein